MLHCRLVRGTGVFDRGGYLLVPVLRGKRYGQTPSGAGARDLAAAEDNTVQ